MTATCIRRKFVRRAASPFGRTFRIANIVLQATSSSKFDEKISNYKDYELTAREAQILKLMTEGFSNMEIAQHLVISVNTTKAHVASILQKLEVDDRLQAALKALKEGLV